MAIAPAIGAAALNLVTTFKFEIGGALAQSKKLSNSIKGVSDQAKMLQEHLKFNIVGASLSLSGLQGGTMGMMHSLVNISEDFYEHQLKLSTLLAGNQKRMSMLVSTRPHNLTTPQLLKSPGKVPITKDFEQLMGISSNMIDRLGQTANKFALDSRDFLNTFNQMNALLLPKGAAGVNLENSSKMARNVMMGADILGLSPTEAAWQMQTLLQGRAQEGMGIFNRLKLETEAFKNTQASTFNRMIRTKPSQAIEKVNKAFDQYLKKAGLQEARLKKVSLQMTILNNQLRGINSPLRQVGDLIRNLAVSSLKNINSWLDKHLPKIAEAFKKVVNLITRDVENFYIQLSKTTRLSQSFEVSKQRTLLLAAIIGILHVVKYFQKGLTRMAVGLVALGLISQQTSKGVASFLASTKGMQSSLRGVFQIFKTMGVALIANTWKFKKAIAGTVIFLTSALAQFVAAWAAIFAVFRVFDSAKAHAEVINLKSLKEGVSGISKFAADLVISINLLLSPFKYLIDIVGKTIAPLFAFSWWLNHLKNLLGSSANNIVNLSRAISEGLVATFTDILSNFKWFTSHLVNTAKLLLTFNFKEFLKMGEFLNQQAAPFQQKEKKEALQNFSKYTSLAEKGVTTQNITLIPNAKIEIRNQFPENIEPNRIATAIREVFEESLNAQIDTRSSAKTFFSGGGVSSQGI